MTKLNFFAFTNDISKDDREKYKVKHFNNDNLLTDLFT